MVGGDVRPHAVRRWLCMWWMIGALAACDPESIADETNRVERRPPPSDARTRDDGPCEGDRADDYGCPGMPCAHGWCAVGSCVGELHGRDGSLLDPGVCCVGHECLAGDDDDDGR